MVLVIVLITINVQVHCFKFVNMLKAGIMKGERLASGVTFLHQACKFYRIFFKAKGDDVSVKTGRWEEACQRNMCAGR